MKKILKNISNSLCITFSKEERTIYQLEAGDIIEIEIKHDGTDTN
jgi:hypothetical protein